MKQSHVSNINSIESPGGASKLTLISSFFKRRTSTNKSRVMLTHYSLPVARIEIELLKQREDGGRQHHPLPW